MKKINELTEQEILNLTDDQIEKMVKLYWAEEGVKMISKPKKPTYHTIPEPDLNRYQISGIDFIFSNIEDAEKTRDFLKKLKTLRGYTYTKTGYHKIDQEFDNNFSINNIPVYSTALDSTISPLKEENEKLETAYNTLNNEYKTEKQKQDELSSRIWNRVYDIRTEYAEMDRIWNIYKNDYLPLAKDETNAMYFLKKAYTINQKTEFYIENQMKKHNKK
jgi:hypothetical protein